MNSKWQYVSTFRERKCQCSFTKFLTSSSSTLVRTPKFEILLFLCTIRHVTDCGVLQRKPEPSSLLQGPKLVTKLPSLYHAITNSDPVDHHAHSD